MNNNFTKDDNCQKCPTLLDNIIKSLWLLIVFFAIYLSFKCNQKFNFLSFLVAWIFSPFYILYVIFFKKFCNT
jgi:hypothetical protein